MIYTSSYTKNDGIERTVVLIRSLDTVLIEQKRHTTRIIRTREAESR
jgi:hypothetical protein